MKPIDMAGYQSTRRDSQNVQIGIVNNAVLNFKPVSIKIGNDNYKVIIDNISESERKDNNIILNTPGGEDITIDRDKAIVKVVKIVMKYKEGNKKDSVEELARLPIIFMIKSTCRERFRWDLVKSVGYHMKAFVGMKNSNIFGDSTISTLDSIIYEGVLLNSVVSLTGQYLKFALLYSREDKVIQCINDSKQGNFRYNQDLSEPVVSAVDYAISGISKDSVGSIIKDVFDTLITRFKS